MDGLRRRNGRGVDINDVEGVETDGGVVWMTDEECI